MWRAQVPRALTGSPPSPQPRALARRAQVPRALTSRPPPLWAWTPRTRRCSSRSCAVRIFAGRWVRRPGPVHVPDWANNLTKVNPEALEKGTHPRNHQAGGLPWARYSGEELNKQAKAGDRPTLRTCDLSFGRPPTILPLGARSRPGHSQAYWGFGHSFTLRQLWGVWESLPLLQGPRQRGPKNKAQNQIRLEGWETLKEDAQCFLKEFRFRRRDRSGAWSTGPWARSSRPGPSSRTPRRR